MASKLNLGRIDHIVQKIYEFKKHVHPDSHSAVDKLLGHALNVQQETESDSIKFLPVDRKKARHKI